MARHRSSSPSSSDRARRSAERVEVVEVHPPVEVLELVLQGAGQEPAAGDPDRAAAAVLAA